MESRDPRARGSGRKTGFVALLGRVGRWTLLVLVLGFALIGFLHVTRGTAVRHVRGVAADGIAISASEPEFPLMATMATGAWLAPGSRLEVTQNGDGIFLADLQHAREITLESFADRSWLQRIAERGANWLTRLL